MHDQPLRSLSLWLAGYGIFLILIGILGYASNPAQAKTALISGGFFGCLNLFWAALARLGLAKVRWAAIVSTLFLAAVFLWRSTVGWMSVVDGEPKLIAATLISLMLLASLALLPVLFRSGK
jgi:uncharacterized membrane protein (UPF0136 family)